MEGRTFVFFEDLDHRAGKAVISAIEFDATGPKGDVIRVLEEPWHLSYPFLIEDGGELWMIPESFGNNDVALYKCIEFPLSGNARLRFYPDFHFRTRRLRDTTAFITSLAHREMAVADTPIHCQFITQSIYSAHGALMPAIPSSWIDPVRVLLGTLSD